MPTDTPKRATRSSSRSRAPVDIASPDVAPTTAAPKQAARRRSVSRGRKSEPEKVEKPKRSRSASRSRKSKSTPVDDEDKVEEETKPATKAARGGRKTKDTEAPPTPRRGRKSIAPADEEQAEPTPAARKPRRSRSRAVDHDDDDDDADQKPVEKATPSKKNSKKQHAVTETPPPPKQAIAARRPRSTSRSRATAVSPVKASSQVVAHDSPIATSPRRGRPTREQSAARHAAQDGVLTSDDEEHIPVMYKTRQPLINIQPIDLVLLALFFIIPLLGGLFVALNLNPTLKDWFIQHVPQLSPLKQLRVYSALELVVFTVLFFFVALFSIAYKLRRSNSETTPTHRIISMIFRGFVSLVGLIVYSTFICKQQPLLTLQSLQASAVILLSLSLVECVYTCKSTTFARIVEQLLSISISSYLLFFADYSQPIISLLPKYLGPVFVIYFVLNLVLSIGYVGALSTNNQSNVSRMVTSLSHAFIWIHLILTLVGPLYVFYQEIVVNPAVLRDRHSILATGLSVALSVLLSFANYADSMSVTYLINE